MTKSTHLCQSVADVSLGQLGLGLVSQTHTGQWSSWFKLTSGLGTGDAVVERDWLAVKSPQGHSLSSVFIH